ncbi:SUKH-3 domain-containing protein [Streptomyces sp. NPDC052496]|uniref:SUKH-3 domain-containing protein n=1 Tax=Streptomyces sp. NPDC052496 TaxID=3154951 RepID=UPI0034487D03
MVIPGWPKSEVEQWLAGNGWEVGRNVSETIDQFVDMAVAQSEKEGFPTPPVPAAVEFLHSFGLLDLRNPIDPEEILVVNPAGGHSGDFEEMSERSGELGTRLFRVGYEEPEGARVLMDESGKFYYMHWSGFFFLGSDAYEAFGNWIVNNLQELD